MLHIAGEHPEFLYQKNYGMFGSYFLKLFSVLKNKENKKNKKSMPSS